MTAAPLPEHESQRLQALRALEILDTLPEQAYDDITCIASEICDTPVALVSLIDEERQWFKSRRGIEVTETARDVAFCAHAILEPDRLLVIEDAKQDPRFTDSPLVAGKDGVRFYAGAPLVTGDGHALGTLCVIDRRPRALTESQLDSLRALSRQIVAQLELRRAVKTLERSRDELARLCELLENQAEVLDRDLQRAEIIQRSLLPRQAPKVPGFCVQTLYRPGRHIGGDLFDVVRLSDRYLVLVVADAVGHGVSAAMLSVLFKLRLDMIDEGGRPYRPSEALARVNAAMLASPAPPGMFVTATYALLDIEQHEVVIASAGHPPVIGVLADGTVDQLTKTGPALGLYENAEYGEHRSVLGRNDRLLFYTDGMFDLGVDHRVTPAQLGAALAAAPRGREALTRLLASLSGAQEWEDRDDVTLLLLDASPGDSCFIEPAGDQEPMAGVAPDSRISYAETEDTTFLCLEGRVTWLHAEGLVQAAHGVIDEGRALVIDLSACTLLDSTLLGTLHELAGHAAAAGARLSVQRASEELVAAFKELSLASVLDRLTGTPQPVPAIRKALKLPVTDLKRQRQRLLKAHQLLAELSGRNREAFAGLIDTLRSE